MTDARLQQDGTRRREARVAVGSSSSLGGRLLETIFPDHRSYGWVVVAACFACGALSAPGQSYALGLYFEAFVTDLGVSRVSVSSLYGWATVAAAALLPVMGRLADRSSSRLFLGAVVAGIGTTLLALAFAKTVVGLAVGLFCLRLLGQGAVGLGTITTVLRWFGRHRGRATAIAALGYAFGEFTMPALITALQDRLGWRGSMMALGATYLLAALLLTFLLRDPTPQPCAGGTPGPSRATFGATDAMRQPAFWGLVGLATIVPMVLTGLLLHQIAIFRSAAWNPADVVSSLRAYAVANLIATYGTGLLLERVPSKFGFVFSMTMLGGGLAIPLLGSSAMVASVAFGAVLGAAAGGATGTNGVIWAEYFGVTSIGAIKGVVNAARNGATAVGAVAFAALAGQTGDYRLPLIAATVLAGAGIVGAIVLPPGPRDLAGEVSLEPRRHWRCGRAPLAAAASSQRTVVDRAAGPRERPAPRGA